MDVNSKYLTLDICKSLPQMRAQQATVIYDVVGQISDAEGLGVALFFNSAGCLLGRALAGDEMRIYL